ncbi:MAG: alkaline shock response membrane anchor protein AmaP [Bacillota bacterium]
MGPFDRGLLLIYSLVFTAFLLVIFLIFARWQPSIDLMGEILAPEQRTVLLGAAVALFVAGLRLMYASLKPRPRSDKLAVVEDNPLGQVRIAVTAVENLVSKVVANFPGVKEVHPKVVPDAEGIVIKVKISTTPSLNIPEVSKDIQQQVKDKVLEVTGISVNSVRVLVENIVTTKPRVE